MEVYDSDRAAVIEPLHAQGGPASASHAEDILRFKLQRVAAGRPRVLDLFSGCGGLSLGFHAAGFDIAAAVEFDPAAARSHGANFHPDDTRHHVPRDITKLSPQELADDLGWGRAEAEIDIIVGGPPCQAFARVGRSKLREVGAHPEAYRHDSRALLYLRYLHYVDAFQPLALLIENVPDVLNHGGQNVAADICEVLQERGYITGYTLLNSAYYGVPQMRERMILVAYRRELGIGIRFPAPSHTIELPSGYAGTRQVALKLLLNGGHTASPGSYVPPPAADAEALLPDAVPAEQALWDLPPIDTSAQSRGVRKFDRPIAYSQEPAAGSYASNMRVWPGFGAKAEGLSDHVIRYLPRDWKLFALLQPGDQYPQAHQRALELFEQTLAERRASGETIEPGSEAHSQIHREIVPPYDVTKFPNKWRKMEPDLPARTLMAHLGKDSYSHIHYDSSQGRTISVREAARLQSFPDGFKFCGAMNAAFRQIGNAVPPLLAKAVATEMLAQLKATAAGAGSSVSSDG